MCGSVLGLRAQLGHCDRYLRKTPHKQFQEFQPQSLLYFKKRDFKYGKEQVQSMSHPQLEERSANGSKQGKNMDKILRGVVKYRQTVKKDLVAQFEEVRNNPKPTAVMFTCMDSRMLPTRFTQSKVGDMFVVRNAGNMIPEAPNYGFSSEVSVTTEPAALELAVKRGGINHIVVCGHSDCKAINTLYGLHQCPKNFDVSSPMDQWVRNNGYQSIKKLNERLHKGAAKMTFNCEMSPNQSFEAIIDPMDRLPVEDKLSQVNVLQQLVNIASHSFLSEHFEKKKLFVHGMWFDIYKGEVYIFSREKKRFIVIDDNSIDDLLKELSQYAPAEPNPPKDE
ncbi:unnamed protein product [Caenorhabditis auriculariae]|uniref:Carbonic anhydrase n=1 Tax=Caenorhabditis auriculariae TaxID=2777116 RepID=A0A8S1HIP1_9PELO|nr:unnamed protein product [Caenorhabditis auriculariae]